VGILSGKVVLSVKVVTHDTTRNPRQINDEMHRTCKRSVYVFYFLKGTIVHNLEIWVRTNSILGLFFTVDQKRMERRIISWICSYFVQSA